MLVNEILGISPLTQWTWQKSTLGCTTKRGDYDAYAYCDPVVLQLLDQEPSNLPRYEFPQEWSTFLKVYNPITDHSVQVCIRKRANVASIRVRDFHPTRAFSGVWYPKNIQDAAYILADAIGE